MAKIDPLSSDPSWTDLALTRGDLADLIDQVISLVRDGDEADVTVRISVTKFPPLTSTQDFRDSIDEAEWTGLNSVSARISRENGDRATLHLHRFLGVGSLDVRVESKVARQKTHLEVSIERALDAYRVDQKAVRRTRRLLKWIPVIIGLPLTVVMGAFVFSFATSDDTVLDYVVAAFGSALLGFSFGGLFYVVIDLDSDKWFPSIELLPDNRETFAQKKFKRYFDVVKIAGKAFGGVAIILGVLSALKII